MELKAFWLACGHIRVVAKETLMPGNPRLLYCDFCKDNKVVIETLKGEEQTFRFPEAKTESFIINKDSILFNLSNGCQTVVSDVLMTDIVKQWETLNTHPGEFFPFYKDMQLRTIMPSFSLHKRESWKTTPKAYLIKSCRDAIDDFLKTGETRFLTDAASYLAILYTQKTQ